jgi:hypothetical protein
MQTPWIEKKQLASALQRNDAFWNNELREGPLMWITVPNAKPGTSPIKPDEEEKLWTDVDYYITAAEDELSRTYYAGDALPVHNPWLGPDQFAAWLGADMTLKPREFTSWVKPFVDDWDRFPELKIDPDNKWWKLYLDMVRRSVQVGKGKWITAYPDLHTGIDGLSAIRGSENLMMDMIATPEVVRRAMIQMTQLWKDIVDVVSDIILPAGQGTSNWTMGWSEKRFLCIGQNDFSCMISPSMFDKFCMQDTLETTNYADYTLYHLDGPDAVRHLPNILKLKKLNCVQWIQGAGKPHPSEWIDLLKQIQAAGKSVQVFYGGSHGGDANLSDELDILCRKLDPTRLFFWATAHTVQEADALIEQAHQIIQKRKP